MGLVLLFFAACAAVWIYLSTFSHDGNNNIQYVEWTGGTVTGTDGTRRDLTADMEFFFPEVGETCRFTAMLPERTEHGTYMVFSGSSMEVTIYLDGQEIYTSAATIPGNTADPVQTLLPLFPGGGEELVMECRVLGEQAASMPPWVRITDDPGGIRSATAAANHYGILAGVTALIFLLAWALFLLGLSMGRPDWSLLLLALAAAVLTVYYPAQEGGWYFLPEGLLGILTWSGFDWMIPAALLAYLLLNRKRALWRSLGIAAAWSAGLIGCAWVVSCLRGGYLADYLGWMLTTLVKDGIFTAPLYWFTLWLTAVCTGLSALKLVRAVFEARAEVQTLRLKSDHILESYQALLEKNTETLRLRHEWKNQLISLRLLQEKKDWAGLAARLNELDSDLERLTPRLYTENLAINIILQRTADRAKQLGVDFRCEVCVPAEFSIDEADLCGFLMNLLENALEAAAQVEPPGEREILCRIRLSQSFLAIHCENTYNGTLHMDSEGRPITTKPDQANHGFGLAQMRRVAEKYNSSLNVSHDAGRFTVETALALPD